jgi:hypothetical protein
MLIDNNNVKGLTDDYSDQHRTHRLCRGIFIGPGAIGRAAAQGGARRRKAALGAETRPAN